MDGSYSEPGILWPHCILQPFGGVKKRNRGWFHYNPNTYSHNTPKIFPWCCGLWTCLNMFEHSSVLRRVGCQAVFILMLLSPRSAQGAKSGFAFAAVRAALFGQLFGSAFPMWQWRYHQSGHVKQSYRRLKITINITSQWSQTCCLDVCSWFNLRINLGNISESICKLHQHGSAARGVQASRVKVVSSG